MFINIYTYTPGDDNDQTLPVWCIILIAFGSLIVIGGILGFIMYRNRMAKNKDDRLLKLDDDYSSQRTELQQAPQIGAQILKSEDLIHS